MVSQGSLIARCHFAALGKYAAYISTFLACQILAECFAFHHACLMTSMNRNRNFFFLFLLTCIECNVVTPTCKEIRLIKS